MKKRDHDIAPQPATRSRTRRTRLLNEKLTVLLELTGLSNHWHRDSCNTMANASPEQQDIDFWEFVSCGRCRMPFSTENNTATIPFWLTECGHIICNNHLSLSFHCCGSSSCSCDDISNSLQTLIRVVLNVDRKEYTWHRCSERFVTSYSKYRRGSICTDGSTYVDMVSVHFLRSWIHRIRF